MRYLIKKDELKHQLVFDIETVPLTENYEELKQEYPELGKHWHHEAEKIRGYRKNKDIQDHSDAQLFKLNAGLYSEFGKIVALCGGVFNENEETDTTELWTFTLADDDEKKLLYEFGHFTDRLHNKRPDIAICGWNSNAFDIPFTLKRYLINGFPIPRPFRVVGVKPWEMKGIDIADLYRINYNTSMIKMDLLASAMGIESSKSDMDGSQVSKIYYSNTSDRLDRVLKYVRDDVVVTAKLARKLAGLSTKLEIKEIDK